ncbi:DUF3526 domain-containing protein [Brevundimonas sp. PAMC22021]|uniref:DUF3526 domain-containing protein n=1 Tax=Brevundimonas sp. PAMC22021 TaxID=2861285 RepID=UPI001C639699|nr:DUF3526 domain-containing protein [Brevundimonas sp. PAMC22021]QYF87376.1 DUF3526 domain-containing protein [Brevundimonas sp. PAMC22021]
MRPSVAGVVTRKDAIELWRDKRLVLAASLTLVLALSAVLTTYVQVRAYERDRAAAIAMESDSWLSQGPRDPHSAAHFSQWTFRPLTAANLLDPGTRPHAGSAVWMEAHARNPAALRAVEDQTVALDLGEFSAAWVIQVLATLLLMVLTAGLVARERERGTLRLLLATASSPRAIVQGKVTAALGAGALVAAPLLLAAAGAVIWAPMALSADIALRTMLWCGVHAVLLVITVMGGVALSVRAKSAAAALALAIGVWVMAVPLIPRVAATAAEAVAPMPSGERFWAGVQDEIRNGFDGSGSAEARTAALRTGLLEQYGVETVEALPISFRGASLDASERFGNSVFERRWAVLHQIEDRQRAVMRVFALISPIIAVQNLSTAAAGTDNLHQRAFTQQAEAERRRVVNALNRDLMINGAGNPAYKADERLWRSLDSFEVRPLPVAHALSAVWLDAVILFAWLIGAMLLAGWSARTLSVEVKS